MRLDSLCEPVHHCMHRERQNKTPNSCKKKRLHPFGANDARNELQRYSTQHGWTPHMQLMHTCMRKIKAYQRPAKWQGYMRSHESTLVVRTKNNKSGKKLLNGFTNVLTKSIPGCMKRTKKLRKEDTAMPCYVYGTEHLTAARVDELLLGTRMSENLMLGMLGNHKMNIKTTFAFLHTFNLSMQVKQK